MKYYVYILESLKDGCHYTGMASDPSKRLAEHNKGKSRFTKGHCPWKLIYQEGPYERMEARSREKKLKSTEGKNRVLKNK